MASINIHYPLRPCYVFRDGGDYKKEKALFHCWCYESEVVAPSPFNGGHPGGTVSATTGIVELEDGSVCQVYPRHIQFLDRKFDEYAFPEVSEDENP